MATREESTQPVWFPSEKDNLRAAIEEVKVLLRDSSELARLSHFQADFRKKKSQVETQLSTAMRTQVDEIRLGLELLQQSSDSLGKVHGNLFSIDQASREVKHMFRSHIEEVMRVNRARVNLDATVRAAQSFREIPDQTDQLLDILEDDVTIKDVYVGMRKLVLLRDQAVTPNKTDVYKQKLEEIYRVLDNGITRLLDRMIDNFDDCISLAVEDPPVLVRTMEAVEMEDRARTKLFLDIPRWLKMVYQMRVDEIKDNPREGDDPTAVQQEAASAVSARPQNLRELFFNRLELLITKIFSDVLVGEQEAEQMKKDAKRRAQEEQARKLEEEQSREREAKLKQQEASRQRKPSATPTAAAAAAGGGGGGARGRGRLAHATAAAHDHDDDDDDGGRAGGAGMDEDDDEEGDDRRSEADRGEEAKLVPVRGSVAGGGGAAAGAAEAEAVGEKKGRGESYVVKTLETLKTVLTDLYDVESALVPCCPPWYRVGPFFARNYATKIRTALCIQLNDLNRLTKVELVKAVTWMQWYKDNIHQMICKLLESPQGETDPRTVATTAATLAEERKQEQTLKKTDVFDKYIEECMRVYLQLTEAKLVDIVENILRVDMNGDFETDDKEHLRTPAPLDLFSMINRQLDLALNSYGLKGPPLYYICLLVADIFVYFQNYQLRFFAQCEIDAKQSLLFGEKKTPRDERHFCAIINNSDEAKELLDRLGERCTKALMDVQLDVRRRRSSESDRRNGGEGDEDDRAGDEDDEDGGDGDDPDAYGDGEEDGHDETETAQQKIEDVLQSCREGFVHVANEALEALSIIIKITLVAPLSELFTQAWLESQKGMADVIATVRDYLNDFGRWIRRQELIGRVVEDILRTLYEEYPRRFVDCRLQLTDELTAQIKQDIENLRELGRSFQDDLADTRFLAQAEAAMLGLFKIVGFTLESLTQGSFPTAHLKDVAIYYGPKSRALVAGWLDHRNKMDTGTRNGIVKAFEMEVLRNKPQIPLPPPLDVKLCFAAFQSRPKTQLKRPSAELIPHLAESTRQPVIMDLKAFLK